MRLSPAQRSFLRKSAAIASAAASVRTASVAGALASTLSGAAPAQDGKGPSPYRLVLAELGDCLRELKLIQGSEAKIARKRDLIGRFDDWVAGVIAAHKGAAAAVQDDVLLTMMVWALDIEDHDRALELVGYVLDNDLAMPERYTRTAPTVIAEISADNALKHITQGTRPDLAWLQLVEESTAEKDMHDEVRAKLHKAIGLTLLMTPGGGEDGSEHSEAERAGGRRAALAAAIPQLKRALQLNDRVGVKKEIEKAERELNKSET